MLQIYNLMHQLQEDDLKNLEVIVCIFFTYTLLKNESNPRPLSIEGSLAIQPYCDTEHSFIMVISENPWHPQPLPNVWQWSCPYMFLRGLSRLGFEHPTFRKRSNPLQNSGDMTWRRFNKAFNLQHRTFKEAQGFFFKKATWSFFLNVIKCKINFCKK